MRFITTKPLQILFPQIRWKGPTDHVYLTFDDGPHPVATPIVLRQLSERGVKATFFLLGSNVERFPDLASQIASQGHTIANHTFDHPSLLFKSPSFVSDQIDRTREAIQRSTGKTTRYFRPPYGLGGPTMYRTAREHHHEVVYWDVDPGDHENHVAETIARRSAGPLCPGSIVLFHDNERTKLRIAEVLKLFFEIAGRRHFNFAPLPA
ncbi:MAG: polysaccharide deacetylase family protein [Bacteroidota bacterium]